MNLKKRVLNWLNKGFPQNYIIRKPLIGSLILMVITFLFILFYKPFRMHPSRIFNFPLTMAIYTFSMALPVLIMASLFKKIRYFSSENEWNVLKEIIASFSVLSIMGLAVYFAGFIMEPPSDRWNLRTFFNSYFIAFMLGLVPVGFFFMLNFRYLVEQETEKKYREKKPVDTPQSGTNIRITSTLKKEELTLDPQQILFAESEGNYVIFHVNANSRIQKKTIRNSITNIEEQLKEFPFLMRVHRAYIINLNQVISQKGNTLGYRVRLNGTDAIVIVSRQNAREFDIRIRELQ
jgi:hypothetical protein